MATDWLFAPRQRDYNLLVHQGIGRLRPNVVAMDFPVGWQSSPVTVAQQFESVVLDCLKSELGMIVVKDLARRFTSASVRR